MAKTIDIANLVIQTALDKGDDLPNLRLQMVLFNLQGYYLAKHHKPLFDDPIYNDDYYSWAPFVPNCKNIYECFNNFGSSPINHVWDEYQFENHQLITVKHELKDEQLKTELVPEILKILKYRNWQFADIVKMVLKMEGIDHLNKDKDSKFTNQEILIWYKIFSKKLDI